MAALVCVMGTMIYSVADHYITGKDFSLGNGREPGNAARHWARHRFTDTGRPHIQQVAKWAIGEHPRLAGENRERVQEEIRKRTTGPDLDSWKFFRMTEPAPGSPGGPAEVTAVLTVEIPGGAEGCRCSRRDDSAFTARITVPFTLILTRHKIISAEPQFDMARVQIAQREHPGKTPGDEQAGRQERWPSSARTQPGRSPAGGTRPPGGRTKYWKNTWTDCECPEPPRSTRPPGRPAGTDGGRPQTSPPTTPARRPRTAGRTSRTSMKQPDSWRLSNHPPTGG